MDIVVLWLVELPICWTALLNISNLGVRRLDSLGTFLKGRMILQGRTICLWGGVSVKAVLWPPRCLEFGLFSSAVFNLYVYSIASCIHCPAVGQTVHWVHMGALQSELCVFWHCFFLEGRGDVGHLFSEGGSRGLCTLFLNGCYSVTAVL